MNEKVSLNMKIEKDLKKKLQYIMIEEEMSITEIVTGFIEYGIREYSVNGKLLK